jgi:hypothetical protein
MSRKIVVSTHGEKDVDEARSLNPTWLLGLGGAAIMLEGCRLVGDIFRAGVFVGVVGIILFVALFVGLVRLLMG